MSILAKINQKESLGKLDKENKREILKAQVLAVLGTMQEPLTAREIAQRIGRTTRQDIQPRITELLQTGIIEEKGRKYDNITNRNVTAYVLAGERIWEIMDKKKALAITIDRIGNLRGFIPKNESERNIAEETLEYLEFVKKMLED